MEHKGSITLETERLILRKYTLEDTKEIFDNWASDSQVTEYLTWEAHKSLEFTESRVKEWVNDYKNNNKYNWGIVFKEAKNQLVGSITVVKQDEDLEKVEIGYCIGKDFWGKGIVTEALEVLIKFFFEEVKANRIEALFDTENVGSGKVMAKCGMKYEGTLRQAFKNNKGIRDTSIYSILAEEYNCKK